MSPRFATRNAVLGRMQNEISLISGWIAGAAGSILPNHSNNEVERVMSPDLEKRLAIMADREEILDLVRRERFARDQRHWQVMRDCFHDDAHIRSSWFDGGADDYILGTQKLMEYSPDSKHWVFPGYIQQHGARATVESPATIFNRIMLNDIEVDFHVYCRFFSRVQHDARSWKLLSFEVLFERDIMHTVNPADPLPIDQSMLAGYRRSYKFLTYAQEARGTRVNPNLYGDDRRDQLDEFYAGENKWLSGD